LTYLPKAEGERAIVEQEARKMGMEIYGKAPMSEEGREFPTGSHTWHGLAKYFCEVAPDIACECKHWDTNDGDGLDAAVCAALADRLIDAMPTVPCKVCGGAGALRRLPGWGADGEIITCKHCFGDGYVRRYVRPFETDYPFDLDQIQRFVKFLRCSGGFEIL